MVAKPAGGAAFAALRREAADAGDLALLPHVWEDYRNITHQTLEVLRAGALDPAVTHTLKARARPRRPRPFPRRPADGAQINSLACCSSWWLLRLPYAHAAAAAAAS